MIRNNISPSSDDVNIFLAMIPHFNFIFIKSFENTFLKSYHTIYMFLKKGKNIQGSPPYCKAVEKEYFKDIFRRS